MVPFLSRYQKRILKDCLATLLDHQVAIYDATNTTKERRAMIKSFCDEKHIKASIA